MFNEVIWLENWRAQCNNKVSSFYQLSRISKIIYLINHYKQEIIHFEISLEIIKRFFWFFYQNIVFPPWIIFHGKTHFDKSPTLWLLHWVLQFTGTIFWFSFENNRLVSPFTTGHPLKAIQNLSRYLKIV